MTSANRTTRFAPRRGLAVLLPAVLAAIACDQTAVEARMVFPNRAPLVVPNDVASLRLTVSGADMADVRVTQAVDGPGTLRASGIPAGTERRVLLEALDASDQLAYYGVTTTEIIAGEVNEVTINLAAAFDAGADTGIAITNTNDQPLVALNGTTVRLRLTVSGAARAIVANDQGFALGRRDVNLAELRRVGDQHFIETWDMNAGLVSPDNGARLVYAKFVSADGVESRAYSAQVRLDFLAPTLTATPLFDRCDNLDDARIAADALWVTTPARMPCGASPDFAGGPIRISFAVDEPVDFAASRVFVRSGGSERPLAIDSDASTESFVVAHYTPQGSEVAPAAGTPNVFAVLTDLGNNEDEVSLGELRFDFSAPAPPDVDAESCIAYERVPWGDETSPNGRLQVGISTSCTTTVVDDAQVARVIARPSNSADDVSLGAAPVAADSFVPILLSGGDRTEVYIESADWAGNRSALRRVRTVWWKATMGHKVLGSSANPNRMWMTRSFAPTLDQPEAEEILLPTGTDAAAPRWRQKGASTAIPTQLGGALLAYDDVRGEVLAVLGAALWQLSASGWRQICGPGTACPGPLVNDSSNTGVAFDSARGVLWQWGGQGQPLWSWDGERWRLEAASTVAEGGPVDREEPGVAFDRSRSRLVVHGYSVDEDDFETWAWDGVEWTLGWECADGAPSCGGPETRSYVRMVDAPALGGIVLVDGAGYQFGQPTKTWLWDGDVWTLLCDGVACSAPPPRLQFGLAFDAGRQRVVLFGGSDNGSRRDLWELSSTGWTQICPVGGCSYGPLFGDGASLVYSNARRRVVLVGDVGSGQTPDTWEWNGQVWHRLCGTGNCGTPDYRSGAAMTFHQVYGDFVMYGGNEWPTTLVSEQWRFNGAGWDVCASGCGTAPVARKDHTMAYDSQNNATLVFGGELAGSAVTDELWTWTGSWNKICGSGTACSGPTARSGAALAYDPANQQVLLFGGKPGAYSDELWRFAAGSWLKLCGAGTACSGPTARQFPAVAFDTARNVLVVFGGASDVDPENAETWEWDGDSWLERCTTAACQPPAGGAGARAIFDDKRGRVVLNGSYAAGAVTYEWDGSTWAEVCDGYAGCENPSGRDHPVFAYDPTRGRALLYSGAGAGFADSTWEWDGGGLGRPAHVFEINFGAAGGASPRGCASDAGSCAIRFLSVVWRAGGRGYLQATENFGAKLQAWHGGAWTDLGASHTAGPAEASDVAGRIQFGSSDPATLERLFMGADHTLHLAAMPLYTRGYGESEIRTTYVEATVGYRLP